MLGLLWILVLWFGVGFAFARYVLGQKDWFTLIPSSLGLGMVLQTLVLNLLLYVIRDNSVLAYWLSVGILGVVGLGAWRWKHGTLEPLELGLSPREFIGAWVVILGLWGLLLPVIWRFEKLDQFWHHPLASVIAANGLPASAPLNPEYCAFYHYAPNLLGGVIFALTKTSFAIAFDWVDTWAVFAVLGLAVNAAWRFSQRRDIRVGVLGMLLFALVGNAGWIYLPFTLAPIRDVTESYAFFDHANTYAAPMQGQTVVRAFKYFARGNFFNPYTLSLHTHSMNLAWVCFFLVLIILWDVLATKRGTWVIWLLMGILLGFMPLAYETFWPVPMALVGIYGLYLLLTQAQHRTILLFHAVVFLIPALALGLGQGGTLTDFLFCSNETLGEGLTENRFPAGPGYYSWLGPEYIELGNSQNWIQALVEWGGMIFLYPMLLFYTRRRTPLMFSFMIAGILPILILLTTDLTLISFDSVRVATLPMMSWGIVLADWLDSLWQRSGGARVLALLVALVSFYSGVFVLYEELTTPITPELRENPYWMNTWLAPIDREIQAEWWNRVGSGDDLIMDLSFLAFQERRYFQIRPPIIFGNYSFFYGSRSALGLTPEIYSLKTCPDPDVLWASGIRYLYIDEVWWSSVSPEGRGLVENPDLFELVILAEQEGQMRRLYRVLEPVKPLDKMSLIRWSPPVDYYSPPPTLDLKDGDLVFYPGSLPYWYQLLFAAMSESELPPEARAFIPEWRATKAPTPLLEGGINYLLLDAQWFANASAEEVALINDPNQYELIGEWGMLRCTPLKIYHPIPQTN